MLRSKNKKWAKKEWQRRGTRCFKVAKLVEKYQHNDCTRQINMGNFVSPKLCVLFVRCKWPLKGLKSLSVELHMDF